MYDTRFEICGKVFTGWKANALMILMMLGLAGIFFGAGWRSAVDYYHIHKLPASESGV